jgi:hypothetical protein
VPAGEVSEPVEISFGVTDQPQPWVERELSEVGWYPVKVDAPPGVPLRQDLVLGGALGVYPLEDMVYRPFIGSYPSRTGEAVVAAQPSAPRPARREAPSRESGTPVVTGRAPAWEMMRTCDIPMR